MQNLKQVGRGFWRGLRWALLVMAGLYAALCTVVVMKQRSFLYFPPTHYITPEAANISMREIKSQTVKYPDGREQSASIFWYAAPRNDRLPVIMFFHGNASAVYSNRHIFSDLMAQGYGVLSVGYPGYPGNIGRSTQSAIIAQAGQQRDWLARQSIPPERVVYMGTSLGAGIAAQLAAKEPPALLVLDAPFNSALDMGKRTMPILPVSLLMKDRYRSDRALENYEGPLMWMHGTADRIIPLAQGQKLYDGYDGGPKTAHVFEDGGHVNLWQIGGREIVLARLSKMFPEGNYPRRIIRRMLKEVISNTSPSQIYIHNPAGMILNIRA